MKIQIVASFIFISVLLTSCHQQQQDFTPARKEEIAKEVKATLLDYCSDIKTSGLLAEKNYLDSSADFFWIPPGSASALSYDAIWSMIKKNAAMYSLVDNSFEELKVRSLSHWLAAYTGRLHSVMTDTANCTNTYMLIETGVLIKRNEGWKLLCGQTDLLPQN